MAHFFRSENDGENVRKMNIKIFECLNEKYVFDVNKNKIIKITNDTYQELAEKKNKEAEYKSAEIARLKSAGYLSDIRPEIIEHPATPFVEDILNNNLQKLCLQVTQNCNFRCKYCVYSGEYENRGHSNKVMSWEIAKKSIDFMIAHSKNSESMNVGFYGGEPLLHFDLIKKCMEYLEESVQGKELTYNMTTNASLLSEDIVEEILKRKFKLTISIDGPKEIQDRNRVLASGKGSYDIVYNNIRSLCEKYPDLKTIINYSMVFDQRYEFSKIEDFVINENALFEGTQIMGNLVNENYKKGKNEWSDQFAEEWEYSKFKYMLFLLEKVSAKYNSKIMRNSYMSLIDIIKNTRKEYPNLSLKDHPSGQCVPGDVRLFISVDGDFFPCEKVSETSNVMNIGNIDKGFDFDKIRYILNVGKISEEECKNCFVFRNCEICSSMCDAGNGNEELSKAMKIVRCKSEKYKFVNQLKTLIVLKKYGFNIDKFLFDATYNNV